MTAVINGSENIISFGEIKNEYQPYFYKYNTNVIPIEFKTYFIKEYGLKLLNYSISNEIKQYILKNINMFLPKGYFEENTDYLDLINTYNTQIVIGVYDNFYKKQKNKKHKIYVTPTAPDTLIFHILLRNISFNPHRPEFIVNTQLIDINNMIKIGSNKGVL